MRCVNIVKRIAQVKEECFKALRFAKVRTKFMRHPTIGLFGAIKFFDLFRYMDSHRLSSASHVSWQNLCPSAINHHTPDSLSEMFVSMHFLITPRDLFTYPKATVLSP